MNTQRLTPEELAAIRERAEKATPGPWRWSNAKVLNGKYDFVPQGSYLADTLIMFGDTYENGEHDAEFIAHAREDIPRLLDALEAAYAEIERLKRKLDAMDDAVYARFGYCEQQNVWADINERLGEEDYE
ncbi:ead/Ea22-like family protein [Brevibacillus sp. NL20B1]|uniref:ead/Ea22-like family protein n=1 Tax=Brevibacillus sp. NL20B1 TaxID=2829799 RepID=UPI001B8DF171|nr:ead/Ea22-like family protein [Brevibacillus sp. NL20B1]MBR8661186.1 ead/Ea22-like family protein [Brevibacillus sp. NL20B1]